MCFTSYLLLPISKSHLTHYLGIVMVHEDPAVYVVRVCHASVIEQDESKMQPRFLIGMHGNSTLEHFTCKSDLGCPSTSYHSLLDDPGFPAQINHGV